MAMFLFFDKRLRALNSEGAKFSGGSGSLEMFWCELYSAVFSILTLIKDILSLHNSSSFMSQNNNSKDSKNSEYQSR